MTRMIFWISMLTLCVSATKELRLDEPARALQRKPKTWKMTGVSLSELPASWEDVKTMFSTEKIHIVIEGPAQVDQAKGVNKTCSNVEWRPVECSRDCVLESNPYEPLWCLKVGPIATQAKEGANGSITRQEGNGVSEIQTTAERSREVAWVSLLLMTFVIVAMFNVKSIALVSVPRCVLAMGMTYFAIQYVLPGDWDTRLSCFLAGMLSLCAACAGYLPVDAQSNEETVQAIVWSCCAYGMWTAIRHPYVAAVAAGLIILCGLRQLHQAYLMRRMCLCVGACTGRCRQPAGGFMTPDDFDKGVSSITTESLGSLRQYYRENPQVLNKLQCSKEEVEKFMAM